MNLPQVTEQVIGRGELRFLPRLEAALLLSVVTPHPTSAVEGGKEGQGCHPPPALCSQPPP